MRNIRSRGPTRFTTTTAGTRSAALKKRVRLVFPVVLVMVSGVAYAKPLQLPVHIVAVEVTLADKIVAPTFVEKISGEMLAERHYYADEGRAVVMHVSVDKLKLKSVGKAMMESVPLVGMFAGANENLVRANISLVDQANGETLGTYNKIEVSDSRGLSAGDVAGELGSTALSFIPIPFLGDAVTTAGSMAKSAGSHDVAELKMSRNLARVAFYEIYGKAAAKAAAQRHKDALAAARLNPKAATAALPIERPSTQPDPAVNPPPASPANDANLSPRIQAQTPMD